ncbi:MAG: tRNA pseudouridine(55) synthase TruB [Clostridia bacterium]|nr:tRNA pseudouridine(55) synthase TruB [Clostridia bacterium]
MAKNRHYSFTKSGIVLVNKPVGISSNAVVNIVKHCLDAKKCGHLGTLDLEGEGLLPVTVNNATKLFDYFLKKDKTYHTIFVFGFETDTLDTSGEIVKQKECDVSKEQVEEACKQMIGKYAQMPPMYSAKKVGGKVAYKEARKGNDLELQPKEIEIYDCKMLQQIDKNKFEFEISCSSGTYIRSVCRDMAAKIDTYGSMQCITRTRCGGFMLDNAYTLDQIRDGKFELLSCENVFDYPNIFLSVDDAQRLYLGQKLDIEKENGTYRLYEGLDFIGLGKVEDKILSYTTRLI